MSAGLESALCEWHALPVATATGDEAGAAAVRPVPGLDPAGAGGDVEGTPAPTAADGHGTRGQGSVRHISAHRRAKVDERVHHAINHIVRGPTHHMWLLGRWSPSSASRHHDSSEA